MMQVGSFVHLGCFDLNEMGTVNEDEVPYHTVNVRSIRFCCRLDNCIVSNNFTIVTAFINIIVIVVFHHYDI